jgi:3-phosphoshikimate 1-carboxyvinyltransferase
MDFHIEPSPVSDAILTVPGDKSISHRALMLGSVAEGTTEISGFLAGEDCLATLGAFRQMGVSIVEQDVTTLSVEGVGLDGLAAPQEVLDLGNSGTAMRLMAGMMAGQSFNSELSGDASLNGRPMDRVITPLTQMGAVIESSCDDTPPLQITGGVQLAGIDYALPVASAQVKSSILLAGLYASGEINIIEPSLTRDHTERMLRTMGVDVSTDAGRIAMAGRQTLSACPIKVPADLSSAAFVMLAALLSDDADLLIQQVGINPTRTGVIDVLKSMGGDISLENCRNLGDEPVADIRVRSSTLQGCSVAPELVSLAIDEFPVLFVAAAAASDVTRFSGIGELRVKESDRIAAMASGLRALGIDVAESEDGAVVQGGHFRGGIADSFGDHRIAMSLAVAATVAQEPVTIRGVDAVDTSFPGFASLMNGLGAKIALESAT